MSRLRLHLACVAMAWPSVAMAASFTLFDAELAHDALTENLAYGAVAASAPADWKSPEDYAGGTVHFRLVVLEKPGATGVMAQACLEQGGRTAGKRACAGDFAFFDKGVHTWSQPLAAWPGASGLDWARKPEEVLLLHKDCFAKPVSSKTTDWVGSPFISLYYPMKARFTAIAVSQGGVFPGWPVSIHRNDLAGGPAAMASRSAPWVRADGRHIATGAAQGLYFTFWPAR